MQVKLLDHPRAIRVYSTIEQALPNHPEIKYAIVGIAPVGGKNFHMN